MPAFLPLFAEPPLEGLVGKSEEEEEVEGDDCGGGISECHAAAIADVARERLLRAPRPAEADEFSAPSWPVSFDAFIKLAMLAPMLEGMSEYESSTNFDNHSSSAASSLYNFTATKIIIR